MNLLLYTKKLAKKIKFYDSMAQNSYFTTSNPFAKPKNITVVWIEEKDNS